MSLSIALNGRCCKEWSRPGDIWVHIYVYVAFYVMISQIYVEVQVKVESVDRGNATLLFILAPDYIFLHSNCKDKAY